MATDRFPDYEIGYGRPPRHTRFKPGTSGNPRGRPKGSKNLSVLLEKELKQRVTINENGRRRRITKQEALIKHMVNRSLSGDPRLLQLLLNEIRLRGVGAGSDAPEGPLGEADREVIQHICERIGQLTKEEVDSGGGDATNAK